MGRVAGKGTKRDRRKKAELSSFKQLLMRIVELVDITAWLPAATGTFAMTLVWQFHSTDSVDVTRAIDRMSQIKLAATPIWIVFLLAFAVVLQGFANPVARVMEGYWGSGVFSRPIRRVSMARQERRRSRLRAQFESRFAEAEKLVAAERKVPLESDESRAEDDYLWKYVVPSHLSAEIQALRSAINEYPLQPSRLLPTKLGNILRSADDLV